MAVESISSMSNAAVYQSNVKPVEKGDAQAAQKSVADTATAQQVQVASVNPVQKVSESSSDGAENASDKKKESWAQQEMSNAQAMKKAETINKALNNNTIAEFGYNEQTNRITIKIKDKDTNKVIREIPSDKALDLLAKAWEMAGILVDEKR